MAGQILLVNLGIDPHDADVRQPVQFHARIHHLALNDVLFDHKSGDGRGDGQRLGCRARFFQFGDLRVGEVVKFQFGPGAVEQRAILGGRRTRFPAQCRQIFRLRAVQFRRINLEQRIARIHQRAGGVHVKLFNPALVLRGHVRQRGFVVIHVGHRADHAAQRPAGDLGGADVHCLDRRRINGNGL